MEISIIFLMCFLSLASTVEEFSYGSRCEVAVLSQVVRHLSSNRNDDCHDEVRQRWHHPTLQQQQQHTLWRHVSVRDVTGVSRFCFWPWKLQNRTRRGSIWVEWWSTGRSSNFAQSLRRLSPRLESRERTVSTESRATTTTREEGMNNSHNPPVQSLSEEQTREY